MLLNNKTHHSEILEETVNEVKTFLDETINDIKVERAVVGIFFLESL